MRNIKIELRRHNWRFCSNPPKCLRAYSRKCGKLPFLVVSPDLKKSLHNSVSRVRTQVAEGSETSGLRNELSTLNKSGS